MQRRTFLSIAATAQLAPAIKALVDQASPEMRLLLDRRQLESVDDAELVIAPSTPHPANPATIDGRTTWTKNNVHAAVFRDASGQYYGWRLEIADNSDENRVMLPIRSADGMKWITTGQPMDFEGAVFRDDRDADPQRRYKMIHHGWAEFDSAGAIARYLNRGAWMAAGGLENHALIRTVFSAVSADGIKWSDRCVVVRENGVQPGKRWWTPGPSGWAGGDNFPCVLWAPDIGKYVSFYRTNIDNGDGQRRERAVGRSESADFRSWEPHSLALRAAPLWQDAMGYRKHDLYQMQVWRCGGVYLGVLSVYYWQEDRVHIELAWSPDTRSWERVCPGSDLVPHPPLGNGRGGCRYGLMRPIPVGDELHVYFGEDNGRHSADKFRAGTVYVARFRRDRLAGYVAKGGGRGSLMTRPFSLRANHLLLNADARGGEIQAELLRESGERLAASEILRSDSLQAELTWGDKKLSDFANARIRVRLLLRGTAKVYAMGVNTL